MSLILYYKKKFKIYDNNIYGEISENDIQKYINYIIEEDEGNNSNIEKNRDNKNENINSEYDDNGSENSKEEENNFEDKKDNCFDIGEKNIE